MNTEQPEALLMAEVLKADGWPSVAAKLQQLHFENQGQAERIQDIYKQLNDTEKEVDDLRLLLRQALEALRYFDDYIQPLTDKFGGPKVAEPASTSWHVHKAIAAIKERLK